MGGTNICPWLLVRPAYSNTAVEIYFPAFLSPSLNVDIAQMQVEKGIMNQSKDRASMIPNPKIEITNLALSLTPSAFTKNSRRTDGWD